MIPLPDEKQCSALCFQEYSLYLYVEQMNDWKEKANSNSACTEKLFTSTVRTRSQTLLIKYTWSNPFRSVKTMKKMKDISTDLRGMMLMPINLEWL